MIRAIVLWTANLLAIVAFYGYYRFVKWACAEMGGDFRDGFILGTVQMWFLYYLVYRFAPHLFLDNRTDEELASRGRLQIFIERIVCNRSRAARYKID